MDCHSGKFLDLHAQQFKHQEKVAYENMILVEKASWQLLLILT